MCVGRDPTRKNELPYESREPEKFTDGRRRSDPLRERVGVQTAVIRKRKKVMSKYAFRRGFAAALLLLVTFVMAGAQEFRGSLTGNVTDPNGAALPGATVEIRSIETNIVNTATTNDEGSYTFPLLNPGHYNITVTAQGFSSTSRENIEIRVADR